MPAIDPQYSEFADFIVNNPSKLANLQAVTKLNQANAQAQQLANQQAALQQANAAAVQNAIGSYITSIGPKGSSPISSPPAAIAIKPTPVPGAQVANPLGDMAVTLPPAAPPDSANTGDANVQASRADIQSRPAPSGSMRTPEGLIIREGSPAAAQYDNQQQTPPAASTDSSQAMPLGAVDAPPPAQPSDGGEAAAPVAAAAAPAQSPFQTEVAHQAASPQNVAAQARQQAIQALVDDPSSLTRHVGAQLLNNPSVNPAFALQWIQQRQTQDADLKKKIADSSTAAIKAGSERLSQADAQLRAWHDSSQTEQRRAQEWPQQTAKMVRDGLLTQEEADHFPQYPGDAQFPTALAYLAHSHELNSAVLKEQSEKADTTKKQAEAEEFVSSAAKAAREAKDKDTIANAKKNDAVVAEYLSPEATAARKANDAKAVTEANLAAAEAKTKTQLALDTLADKNHLTPEQRATQNREWEKINRDTEGVKLTPAAVDKMAEMFATTGQLPALGMGKQAAQMRSDIINRATNNYPAVQFATNRAVFDANKSELAKLQAQQGLSEAFAQTAGKNLDTFLSTAKNIVDSGVPWINTPLRAVAKKALGSEDQAAFNTARFVALSEVARVLTASPSGGGVVSDRARQEAEELVGPDATLKQVYKAATIIKQDMDSRRQSYADSVNILQQRIGDMLKGQQQNAIRAAEGDFQIGHIYGKPGQEMIYQGGPVTDQSSWKKK